MPLLEFLTVRRGEACPGCDATEEAIRQEMDAIGKRKSRDEWVSDDGKCRMRIRHVDVTKRHLPRELAPFILLDGTLLALSTEAVAPDAIRQITRIFCPDGWTQQPERAPVELQH